MEGVLAAFAQFDNDVRSDRTRAGMRAALELGRWTLPAPLGYLNAPKSSGMSLVLDPERAPLIRRAFEELATGRFTKQEVIARVTEAGLRTRRGLVLSPQSFGQMMRNSIYVAKVESPDYGVSTRGDFEPLVDEATFYRVQAVVDGRVVVCRTTTEQPSRLSAARIRQLRGVRPTADGELVEGTQWAVRVLPLPTAVPRREREQGQAGRRVR